jgi:hypothetical protein
VPIAPPRNEDGYADRCTALALCLRASETLAAAMIFVPPSPKRLAWVAAKKDRSMIGIV